MKYQNLQAILLLIADEVREYSVDEERTEFRINVPESRERILGAAISLAIQGYVKVLNDDLLIVTTGGGRRLIKENEEFF